MSDASDDAEADWALYEASLEGVFVLTDTWITREGEEIAVRDMEDSHLLNTIRFIEKKYQGQELPRVYDRMRIEKKLRGLA